MTPKQYLHPGHQCQWQRVVGAAWCPTSWAWTCSPSPAAPPAPPADPAGPGWDPCKGVTKFRGNIHKIRSSLTGDFSEYCVPRNYVDTFPEISCVGWWGVWGAVSWWQGWARRGAALWCLDYALLFVLLGYSVTPKPARKLFQDCFLSTFKSTRESNQHVGR